MLSMRNQFTGKTKQRLTNSTVNEQSKSCTCNDFDFVILQEKSFSFSSSRGYYGGIPQPYGDNPDKIKRGDNPHKYVLYKPSITQILMFLATGNFAHLYTNM